MSQRMTAAEVVVELRVRDRYFRNDENNPLELGLATAYRAAADLVEQHLTPQVLDEPDGDGDYWIEGREGVHQVEWSTVKQMWCRRVSGWREPIEKARVAKVPPGPFSKETLE